ncbi:uncharacterized protein LOC114310498 isoform X1 [Camellia sinensis]|uniref:uncharacterized protein LOC114310498 isoform X1 n=1 Tax=Camellia sinensis TaxID=4442 RepID=UPI001036E918|nr:uncharacterized protein LOC114310498 isoform X1 [Camellia sinensis]
MASLHCSASTLPSQSILGFRRPTIRTSTTPLTLAANVPLTPSNFSVEPEPISNFLIRFKNAVRLQVRQSLFSVFASNANPSDQDPLTEKSGGIKTNDAGQGPPLPTILAGLVVFFLIFWIIGSILTWLISLIVRFPPSE